MMPFFGRLGFWFSSAQLFFSSDPVQTAWFFILQKKAFGFYRGAVGTIDILRAPELFFISSGHLEDEKFKLPCLSIGIHR